ADGLAPRSRRERGPPSPPDRAAAEICDGCGGRAGRPRHRRGAGRARPRFPPSPPPVLRRACALLRGVPRRQVARHGGSLPHVGSLPTLRSWITSFVLFVLMASATAFQDRATSIDVPKVGPECQNTV